MLKINFKFHAASDLAQTYNVVAVDAKTKTLAISFVKGNEVVTTSVFLPMAEKFLLDGTWLAGRGSDVMMIRITKGYKSVGFHSKESAEYAARLQAVSGEWLEVDDTWLVDNQYTTVCGLHVMDTNVIEVKNDKRVGSDWQGRNKPFFQLVGGVKPIANCFFKDLIPATANNHCGYTLWDNDNTYFPDNFTLSTCSDNSYYQYTNNRRTNIRFVYKDGVFFDVESGKVLKGVSVKPMTALTKFFKTYHKAV